MRFLHASQAQCRRLETSSLCRPIFTLPTYCEANLSRNREIEFSAGSHDETIRMRFDDYKRLANPKMIHFAQPYESGVQRLAP